MLKKLIAATLGLFVAVAFAASVDANKASQAELEALKGVGPGIATKILDERKKGAFKDWADMVDRVKGVGEGSAAKLSAEGLTVNGAAFKPTAATAPAVKKDEAKAAKAEMKADAKAKPTPAAATPATPAVAATPAMPAKPAPTVAAAADEAKKATAATQTAKAAAAKASEPAKK